MYEYESSEDEEYISPIISITLAMDASQSQDIVRMMSPIIPLTLTMDASQLRGIVNFYHKLTDHYTSHHNLNTRDDPFIFYPKLMDQVNNFTSTNHARKHLSWEETTNCRNNFAVSRYKITRKLKFKPLSIALGIYTVSSELPIIRANYFFYTYNELNYILYVADTYDRDSDLRIKYIP